MTYAIRGTVSHGTMRPQDLIPAFLDVARDIAPDAYAQMMFAGFPPIPAYVVDEGDASDWWRGEDCAALLESLFELLNEHAPEGYYFGAHPGDGSDFGFWECES
jgi:hypothetical protein